MATIEMVYTEWGEFCQLCGSQLSSQERGRWMHLLMASVVLVQILQDELQEVLKVDAEKEASLLDTLASYEQAKSDLAALQAADAGKAAQLKEASEVAQARASSLHTSHNNACGSKFHTAAGIG